MRDRLADEAKKNGRSMNAEIVARLSESLDHIPAERAFAKSVLADAHELLAQFSALRQEVEALRSHPPDLGEALRTIAKHRPPAKKRA